MIAKLETENECKILRVSGRIDFESALDFEQQINAMIQQGGDCFIIELSEVELLSSAGLRVLLSTAKRVSHRDAMLGLAAPSQVVCQVFEISHFNLLFKIFPSIAEAVAALKGTSHSAKPVSPAPMPTGNAPRQEKASGPASESRPIREAPVSRGERNVRQEAAPAVSAQTPSAGEPSRSGSDRTVPETKGEGIPAKPASMPPPLPAVKTSPPPVPPAAAETVSSSAQTIPPAVQPARPSQTPQALIPPPPLPATEKVSPAAPAGRRPQPPPIQKPAESPPRVPAPFPAQLEVRAEGNTYSCKDGDVIGEAGQLGRAYFVQIPGLAQRHLLIGKTEGRWFVFTPKNVQHPFLMDGHPLVAGEPKFLEYTEHQLEFNGHVFGLRLVPEQKKRGFLSRIFGKK
jgi:anti-sigma B factor antagonist